MTITCTYKSIYICVKFVLECSKRVEMQKKCIYASGHIYTHKKRKENMV